MRHLQVSIPDGFYNSFIEFLKQLPEVEFKEEGATSVSEPTKSVVKEKSKKSKDEDFLPWEEAKKQLKDMGE